MNILGREAGLKAVNYERSGSRGQAGDCKLCAAWLEVGLEAANYEHFACQLGGESVPAKPSTPCNGSKKLILSVLGWL